MSYTPPAVKIEDTQFTLVSNVSTGETDLMTFSLPANSLNFDGDSIEVEAYGFFANNANTKTIRFYFGSTPVAFTVVGTGGSITAWYLKAVVIRNSSSTMTGVGTLFADSDVAPKAVYINTLSAGGVVYTGTNTIKLTGVGGATNDIRQQSMITKLNSLN